jgi:hypothetical protein
MTDRMTDRKTLDRRYRTLVGLAINERYRKSWRQKWQAEADDVKRQRDALADAMHKKAGDDLVEHVKRTKGRP